MKECLIEMLKHRHLSKNNPVNLVDFSLVAADWMLSGPGLAGDTNGNDNVNMDDLLQVIEHYLSDCSL